MVAALIALLGLPAGVGLLLCAAGRLRIGPGLAYATALVTSVVTLALAIVVTWQRPVLSYIWIPAIGSELSFAMDGISEPLVLLTAALGVAVVLHVRRFPPQKPQQAAYGLLALVQAGALATFLTRDAMVFFLAFEVVLVPIWLLIRRYGEARYAVRADAANRFLLYTVLGSTLMLVGILGLRAEYGTFDLPLLRAGGHGHGSVGTQTVIAVVLLAGLAIKVPLWPVHTWLPPAHTVAPTAGSVLLAAVLLKMGTYGIVRLVVAPLPLGLGAAAPYLAVLAAISILWGSLACLVERDLKRLVAYSSVAHMGFVVLGIASGTQTGLQAALFANVAHGIVSALLFLVVGGLKSRWGEADLRRIHTALREGSPRLGLALVVGFAAALGLPGLAVFWGEFLALYSAWSPAPDRPLVLMRIAAIAGVAGTGLAAGYALRVLRLVWVGDLPRRDEQPATDARGVEWWVLGTLGSAAVVLGVAPGLLLSLTSAEVATLIGGRR